MAEKSPVEAGRYTEEYFLNACGGSEFFKLYGAKILKPAQAYSLSRAGVAAGMKVLDVGCGRGEILFHVKKAGAEGIGTDYAEAALKIASEVSGCPTMLADAKKLPFPPASFDRIFFLGVIDHLHDWELESCFKEFARVLKPGGFVLVHTCTNKLYYKNWTYAFRRTLARALGLREPSRPRSDEDETMHVNEHSLGSMRAFFKRIGWRAEIEPRPNPKLELRALYGDPLPADLPLKPVPGFRVRLYRTFLWRDPLKRILARELFCVAHPPA